MCLRGRIRVVAVTMSLLLYILVALRRTVLIGRPAVEWNLFPDCPLILFNCKNAMRWPAWSCNPVARIRTFLTTLCPLLCTRNAKILFFQCNCFRVEPFYCVTVCRRLFTLCTPRNEAQRRLCCVLNNSLKVTHRRMISQSVAACASGWQYANSVPVRHRCTIRMNGCPAMDVSLKQTTCL